MQAASGDIPLLWEINNSLGDYSSAKIILAFHCHTAGGLGGDGTPPEVPLLQPQEAGYFKTHQTIY